MQHKYKAFISYSHRDTAFATWLHKTLETFAIPKAIVGLDSPLGTVPAKLFPVFRDREELPTATDLGHVIENALTESASLLVLCSPRSAASMWVNQEVLNYQRIQGVRNIVAIVIDGEFNPAQPHESSALVPALRDLLTPVVPLNNNNQIAVIDARGSKAQRQQAFVRLLSQLLGQPLATLQRQINARKRQRTVLASVAAIAMLSGLWGLQHHFLGKQRAAEQAELQARLTKQLDAIQNDLAQQQYASALVQGNSLLQQHSDDLSLSQHNTLMAQLHNALSNNRQINVLSAHQAAISNLQLNQDDSRLLSLDDAGVLILWDTLHWRELKRWHLNSEQGYVGPTEFWFSADGDKLVLYNGQFENNIRLQVFDSISGKATSADMRLTDAGIVDVPFWFYQPDILLTRRFEPIAASDNSAQWLDFYDLDLQKKHSIRLPECGDYFSLQLVVSLAQTQQVLVADDNCGGYLYDDGNHEPQKHFPGLTHAHYGFNLNNSYHTKQQLILLKPENGQYALWDLQEWQQRLSFNLQQLNYYQIIPDNQSIKVWGCNNDYYSSCKVPIAQHISESNIEELSSAISAELQTKGQKWPLSAGNWLVENYKKIEHITAFQNTKAKYTTFPLSEEHPALTVATAEQWYVVASGSQLDVRSLQPRWHHLSALPFQPDELIRSPSGEILIIPQRYESEHAVQLSYASDTSYTVMSGPIPVRVWHDDALWSADENWVLLHGWNDGSDSKRLLMNVKNRRIVAEFSQHDILQTVFTADNKTLTLYDNTGTLSQLALTADEVASTATQPIPDHTDKVALSSDGHKLVVVNSDGKTLTLYHTLAGAEPVKVSDTSAENFSKAYNTVLFSADNQYLFAHVQDGNLQKFDTQTLTLLSDSFPEKYWISEVINHDLLLLEDANTVLLWSLSQQQTLLNLTPYLGINKWIDKFYWDNTSNTLLLDGSTGTAPLLVDLSTTPQIKPLTCGGKVPDLYHLNQSKQLFVATFNGHRFDNNAARLCVADLTSGNVLLNTELPSHFVIDLQYQAESAQIALLLSDGVNVSYQLRHTDLEWITQGAKAAADKRAPDIYQ